MQQGTDGIVFAPANTRQKIQQKLHKTAEKAQPCLFNIDLTTFHKFPVSLVLKTW